MENLIFKKLILIMQECDAIGKNKKNLSQNYSFRGIDDMYNALHPLFAKHGVFITSEVVSSEREERITKGNQTTMIYSIIDAKFTFFAEDGSNVSSTLKGEAMDSGDKASNKAISAALKYALMQMFLIPTQEKIDTEYDSPEPVAKKTEVKKVEPPKPITDILFEKAIDRIKAGEFELKEKVAKQYILTTEQLEKIKAA